MKTLRRKTAARTIVVELTEAEWELLSEREHQTLALRRAAANLDANDVYSGLEKVVKLLPLAAGVEMASIRLASTERDALHLVAREGLPTRHVRELALDPISRAKQRSLFALRAHHSQARKLGLRFLAGEWLECEAGVVGSLTVGCRTDRLPSLDQQELIKETASALGAGLADVDRSEKRLRNQSLTVAGSAIVEPPDVPATLLAALRPREATVLELYASGQNVDEIAALLVISPHTVRTHIKLAFRRLGIHSREEAAELVQAHDVMALI